MTTQTVICRRINLLDKVEVILVLWKGGGWMALEADVLPGSKEETEAKPQCFASITQCLFQKPLLGAERLCLLQAESIFGHSGRVPAKDAS